jgi:DNA-binding winged helix-turn-helix (wHTH) protein/Tol biopolymer transport system component
MSQGVKSFYRFGEFTVDGEQRVLLRNNTPLPMAPKVFDTLLILVANSGRIVEKEELINRLWPDSFVEESNVTVNIQQLRKSLGDNARQPRFVETVARRGYRFIAEVTKPTEPTIVVEPELTTTEIPTVSGISRSYLSIAAISILVVGSLVIALWFASNRNAVAAKSAPILSAPFKSEKFATGGVVRAVITPDGKYSAYTIETGGKESIWLRQLATSENMQIVPPTDEQYLGLTISHDGNSLYFVRVTRTDPPTSAIYRVMTFGGIPVKVVDHTEGTVSFSPDDEQLSFIRCKYQDDDFCSLMVIDTDGKNERKLLTRQRPIRLAGAQFSPDGKSIAFASGQSWNGGSDFRLMGIDLASGAEHLISQTKFFDIKNLKWLPDGEGMLLTAKETLDGRLRIWHVATATGETRALTNDATDYMSLSLNKAADKLIATHTSNTFHLYLARMEDLNNPKNLAVARYGFTFAPDGKLIYEGNDSDIWTINREGGEQRQLTNNSFADFLPRVSPDGRYVFFTSNRSGSNHVWRMNADDGSNPVQVTKQEGGYPQFVSTDSNWVYYFASGNNANLRRVPAQGGEETQVSLPSLSLSPDGKVVAYFSRGKDGDNRVTLALMAVEEKKIVRACKLVGDRPLPSVLERISGWSSDSKNFFYLTTDGFRNHLWRQSLDAESPKLIGDLGTEEIAHFAVAPDGMSFAFIRGRWIHDAVLIEGLK